MAEGAGVLILGAGQAAAQAAHSLRQAGYEGPVAVLGDELFAPYQRPPLSKAYLLGEMSATHLELKPADFWSTMRVRLDLGARATGIDRAARRVRLADGSTASYETLILALGARARTLPLPGAKLDGVVTLRTLADADVLQRRLKSASRVVVVGGGFIGLEIAAAARKFGAAAAVLEAAPRLMARTGGRTLSDFYAREHCAHGVDIRLSTPPKAFEGEGRVRSILLADGSRLKADLAVVGVGALPNVEIAQAAGLEVADGIVTDAAGRTSDPAIFAIGDCASAMSPLYGRRMRLESVQNAIDGAKAAAAAITGTAPPHLAAPWNWSDQYDLKLQIAGVSTGFDREVVRGDPASRAFAVFYFAGSKLLGCDAVNAPAEFVVARQLIAKGDTLDPAALIDASRPMKSFLKQP
jgi:3-phenylpropionate/trans-cinnamate dioxygenase ferredoxin reductase subunit